MEHILYTQAVPLLKKVLTTSWKDFKKQLKRVYDLKSEDGGSKPLVMIFDQLYKPKSCISVQPVVPIFSRSNMGSFPSSPKNACIGPKRLWMSRSRSFARLWENSSLGELSACCKFGFGARNIRN